MAAAQDSIIVITFGAARIDPSSFEKWVDGLELLVSTREWKNTGFGGLIHLVRQSVVVIGDQNKEKALSLLGYFGFVCDVTSEEVHLCRPSDMYLGPDAFVYHVQAWRSRSQRRAGCCRL